MTFNAFICFKIFTLPGVFQKLSFQWSKRRLHVYERPQKIVIYLNNHVDVAFKTKHKNSGDSEDHISITHPTVVLVWIKVLDP